MNTNVYKPRISIITSTLNVAGSFSRSIESVRFQTYDNFEWIVVDGASIDGTQAIIEANKDIINVSISEPDSGIYEAWNKGVMLSSGDYICFLGGDDSWVDCDSLDSLVNALTPDIDLVSARASIVARNGDTIRCFGEPWSVRALRNWQMVCHPGMLVKRDIFDVIGKFDVSYRIAGDYDWLLRMPKNIKSSYLDEVIINMSAGGVSDRKIIKVLVETRRAQIRNLNRSAILININMLRYYSMINLGKLKRLLFKWKV